MKEGGSNVLARVYNKILTQEEALDVIPKNVSPKDSLEILNRYIKSWVTKQLLLKNAEENLDINEAEVERKILDYRYALIVYEFEKQYTLDHLDTIVTNQEVLNYYNNNLDNFELKQNIVKGMFVKVPNNAPKLTRIKSLLKSEKKDHKNIRSFCYRFATDYVLEDTVWNSFEELILNSPFSNIPDKVQFLKKTRYAEISDSNFTYLISINDYKIVDQNSPIEFVKDQIISIILNKRKTELVQELEKKIYNKALKNKDFEIYTQDS